MPGARLCLARGQLPSPRWRNLRGNLFPPQGSSRLAPMAFELRAREGPRPPGVLGEPPCSASQAGAPGELCKACGPAAGRGGRLPGLSVPGRGGAGPRARGQGRGTQDKPGPGREDDPRQVSLRPVVSHLVGEGARRGRWMLRASRER